MFSLISLGAALLLATSGFYIAVRSGGFPRLRRLPILLSLLCIIPGLGLLQWEQTELKMAFERRGWPTVEGRITETQVVGERAFRPVLSYEYLVEGTMYSGKTDLHISGFGNKRSRKSNAQSIARDHAPGTQVSVYYNPRDPSDSILRPGPFWSDYLKYVVGLLLSALGIFLIGLRVLKFKS